MLVRRGMGDAPAGLQPPWYCGMPPFSLLPSCISAFSADVGAVAGGTAATIVQGVKTGAATAWDALIPPSNTSSCEPSDFWCNYGTYMIFGGVAVAAIAFLLPPGRRRR